ncbi:MAG: hypothetical protein M1477_02040 [Candidatus Thermoplasmatota archaeon]|nr:hypothetical protein [Candidatus Thermoplasmatota archaeon]
MTSVNLRALKERAIRFPEPVKSLILSEPDEMDSDDFISKLGTWEKLVKISQNGGIRK